MSQSNKSGKYSSSRPPTSSSNRDTSNSFRPPSSRSFRSDNHPDSNRFPVMVNGVLVKFHAAKSLWEHKVTFTSSDSKSNEDEVIAQSDTETRREIICKYLHREIKRIYGAFTFDNTRLYALSNKNHVLRYRDISVNISTLRNYNLHDDLEMKKLTPEFIKQIAHVIHKDQMKVLGYKNFGDRGFFLTDPNKSVRINSRHYGDKLRALPGFRTSITRVEIGHVLFVQNHTRLMEARAMNEIMDDIFTSLGNPSPDEYIGACDAEFRNRYFITTHTKKHFRVSSIDFSKNIEDTFECRGRQISYIEYYKKYYNEDLKYRQHGMICYEQKNGGVLRFPAELCVPTGHSRSIQDELGMRQEIARGLAIAIKKRVDIIQGLVDSLIEHNENQQNNIFDFGNSLLQVNARQLPEMSLHVFSDRGIQIPEHDLRRELKNIQFLPLEVTENLPYKINYAIVYFDGDQNYARNLSNTLEHYSRRWSHGREHEYIIYRAFLECIRISHNTSWANFKNQCETRIKEICKMYGAIIIILPSMPKERQSQLYSLMKRVSIDYETISQCVCPKWMNRRERNQDEVLNAMFRQFLVKLGFLPWRGIFTDENGFNGYLPDKRLNLTIPTMIIGMDVFRDTKCQTAFAGFVATYDPNFCRVHSQLLPLKKREEIIPEKDIKNLFRNALESFHAVNGTYPHQIIVYRDGVSESELQGVKKIELGAMKAVRAELEEKDGDMKIEFIVVQKSNIIRLFLPLNNGDYDSVPPRTIIDEGITSAVNWEFYLVSSRAPKGKTANPTRCIIIHDELRLQEVVNGRIGINDIEYFTYGLCCLYFNWPGAVRVPHVVKYADKIARFYADLQPSTAHTVMPNDAIVLTPHYI